MDALYFPALSLPGAAWTNPNLLYFDRIGVIAPPGNPRELFDGPTRMLIDYDLVRPIDPQRYALDDRGDEAVLAHLLGMAQSQRPQGPMARIHLGKISYTCLPTELIRLGMLQRCNGSDWLEGPGWVAEYIMSALATRMLGSRDLQLSPVTDRAAAMRLVAGVPTSSRATRRLQAVAKLLPIGPDAEIDDILRFRERHGRELKRFRECVEALIRRSPEGRDGLRDFEARLRDAEELRRHLIGQLEPRQARNNVEIALSIGAIAAPIVEHSPYSTGVAVLGLGYLLYKNAAVLREHRDAVNNKLVYAALASRHFLARRAQNLAY